MAAPSGLRSVVWDWLRLMIFLFYLFLLPMPFLISLSQQSASKDTDPKTHQVPSNANSMQKIPELNPGDSASPTLSQSVLHYNIISEEADWSIPHACRTACMPRLSQHVVASLQDKPLKTLISLYSLNLTELCSLAYLCFCSFNNHTFDIDWCCHRWDWKK